MKEISQLEILSAPIKLMNMQKRLSELHALIYSERIRYVEAIENNVPFEELKKMRRHINELEKEEGELVLKIVDRRLDYKSRNATQM